MRIIHAALDVLMLNTRSNSFDKAAFDRLLALLYTPSSRDIASIWHHELVTAPNVPDRTPVQTYENAFRHESNKGRSEKEQTAAHHRSL